MHADGAAPNQRWHTSIERDQRPVGVERDCPDALIMNIDDLLCVGATDNILVSSTIGRNKNKIPEVIAR